MTEKNIGEYLRAIREEQGIDILQVSDQTKINLNVLRKLEANDLSNLPNKAYVRGFVQSYAKVIKVDIKIALDVLDQTYRSILGESEPEEEAPIELPEAQEPEAVQEKPIIKNSKKIVKEVKSSFSQAHTQMEPSAIENFIKKIGKIAGNKKIYIPTVLLALISSLISFTYNHMSEKVNQNASAQEENKQQEALNEIKDKKTPLFLLESAKKIRKEVAKEEDVIVEDPKEEVAVEVPKKEKIETAAKIAEIKASDSEDENIDDTIKRMREQGLLVQTPKDLNEARAVVSKSDEMIGDFPFVKFYNFGNREVFKESLEQELAQDTDVYPEIVNEAVVSTKENVLVSALDGDSWLTYKIENKQVKSLVLRKGKKLFLQGNQILLFMGNANVTRIFYNKKKIDFESRTGVKSLVFPKENAPKYDLPLFVANKKGILYTASDYKSLMDEQEEEE